MKKWLNYLPTIFILSIVLSLVFYSSQGSTVQMNYTQFEKIVDEVDFKKSSMTISSTVIQLVLMSRTQRQLDTRLLFQEQKRILRSWKRICNVMVES